MLYEVQFVYRSDVHVHKLFIYLKSGPADRHFLILFSIPCSQSASRDTDSYDRMDSLSSSTSVFSIASAICKSHDLSRDAEKPGLVYDHSSIFKKQQQFQWKPKHYTVGLRVVTRPRWVSENSSLNALS